VTPGMSLTVMLSVMEVMTLLNTLTWLAESLSVRSRMNFHTFRSMSKLHSTICNMQKKHGTVQYSTHWLFAFV
jgi:hypothetical protein